MTRFTRVTSVSCQMLATVGHLAIEKSAPEFLMSDASVFHQWQIARLVANVIQQRVRNNIRITKKALLDTVTQSIQRRVFVSKHRIGLGQFVRNLAIAQSAVFDFSFGRL